MLYCYEVTCKTDTDYQTIDGEVTSESKKEEAGYVYLDDAYYLHMPCTATRKGNKLYLTGTAETHPDNPDTYFLEKRFLNEEKIFAMEVRFTYQS